VESPTHAGSVSEPQRVFGALRHTTDDAAAFPRLSGPGIPISGCRRSCTLPVHNSRRLFAGAHAQFAQTWTLAVFTLMIKEVAISRLVWPATRPISTSLSRRVGPRSASPDRISCAVVHASMRSIRSPEKVVESSLRGGEPDEGAYPHGSAR